MILALLILLGVKVPEVIEDIGFKNIASLNVVLPSIVCADPLTSNDPVMIVLPLTSNEPDIMVLPLTSIDPVMLRDPERKMSYSSNPVKASID